MLVLISIKLICLEESIDLVVLGYPKHMNNTVGEKALYVEKFKKLLEVNILDNLRKILNLWEVITDSKKTIENESWSENKDILKVLNILTSYPNEFWKYPVIVYYLSHRNKKNFEKSFLKFLRKLYVELLKKYIEIPTINAVKANILKLNAEIISSDKPVFDFKSLSEDEIKEMLNISSLKLENPEKYIKKNGERARLTQFSQDLFRETLNISDYYDSDKFEKENTTTANVVNKLIFLRNIMLIYLGINLILCIISLLKKYKNII